MAWIAKGLPGNFRSLVIKTQGPANAETNAIEVLNDAGTSVFSVTRGGILTTVSSIEEAVTITSNSASALTVGRLGATNPVLKVNANTASVATGISITGAAAAGGVAVAAISSAAAENVTLDAKGTGTITLGGTSTGNISLGNGDKLRVSSAGTISLHGDNRIDLTSCTVLAGNTDGGILKAGTAAAPIVEDTADMKFVSIYTDCGATSGDARGIYNRLYITGAGGGGESLRTFTTVSDVAGATAHGAHTSLSFGSTGSITGLGVAGRNTLHVPNAAMTGGTYTALQAEVWSDGASSDITGVTKASYLRVVNDGNATGKGKTDDKVVLFEITGGTSGTGNLVFNSTVKVDVLGDTRYLPLSNTEDELSLFGDSRINLSSCTVKSANSDGGILKAGTSSARVVEDTADVKFVSIYTDCGALSGDARGIYNRLYITGAGGGGESLRSFTTVEDVAGATAHGAHLSLNFNASGSITGLGVASRNTLHIANAALAAGGTYAATQPELYADGAASDPAAVTELSFIRCVNDGHATGIGTIDDKAFLLTLAGGSVAAGNVMAAKTSAAVTHTLRIKGPDGATYYLMVSNAQ